MYTSDTEKSSMLYETPKEASSPTKLGLRDRIRHAFRFKIVPWVTTHYQIVVLAIAVIILAEIIWGTNVLSTANIALKKQTKQASSVPISTEPVPSIQLFSDTLQAKVGQDMSISVNIDTLARQADAATVVLTYNPAKVTFKRIENGTTFTEYTEPKVDSDTGRITISGIMAINSSYIGEGLFARVHFTPKTSGEATFNLQYTPEATDETTIAAQGKEILGKVAGTKVLIQ